MSRFWPDWDGCECLKKRQPRPTGRAALQDLPGFEWPLLCCTRAVAERVPSLSHSPLSRVLPPHKLFDPGRNGFLSSELHPQAMHLHMQFSDASKVELKLDKRFPMLAWSRHLAAACWRGGKSAWHSGRQRYSGGVHLAGCSTTTWAGLCSGVARRVDDRWYLHIDYSYQ